jgi:protease IV
METEQKKSPKMSFSGILKNVFWVILILQFAPVAIKNISRSFSSAMEPKTLVGQLNVKGPISDSTFYVRQIHKFLKDKNVKALFLKIDSPGGTAGSSQAIYKELLKFKEQKPIVALVENVAASGGYQVAAASNYIIAPSPSTIGSIGVWLSIPPNLKGISDKWDIKFRHIQSGKYKTAGHPFREDNEEELSFLQSLSDDAYNQFLKDMASARNLSLKNKSEWAEGKIFTGNQALKLKLIDQTGSFSDAITKLKELGKITTEIKFAKPKRPSKFMRLFGGQDDESSEESMGFSSQCSAFVSNIIDGVLTKQATKSISAR